MLVEAIRGFYILLLFPFHTAMIFNNYGNFAPDKLKDGGVYLEETGVSIPIDEIISIEGTLFNVMEHF
ncbi:MAG: hypothetical protein PUF65_05415 [Lachnospiraceae bacterium]|nr:hypothetical protein [Lachnospiraceae bacterium]